MTTRPAEHGTLTLTEFLTARLAEDEEVARKAALSVGDEGFGDERIASGQEWTTSYHEVRRTRSEGQRKRTVADAGDFVGMSIAPHIARHDPARVLREVEAKRAIVAVHSSTDSGTNENDEPYSVTFCDNCHDGPECATLRHLAAVYSDHPDYRDEWRV